jgi:hypothetical protein
VDIAREGFLAVLRAGGWGACCIAMSWFIFSGAVDADRQLIRSYFREHLGDCLEITRVIAHGLIRFVPRYETMIRSIRIYANVGRSVPYFIYVQIESSVNFYKLF